MVSQEIDALFVFVFLQLYVMYVIFEEHCKEILVSSQLKNPFATIPIWTIHRPWWQRFMQYLKF